MVKIMYVGASTALERLNQSFEVVPLNFERTAVEVEPDEKNDEIQFVYKHVPSGVDAIVIGINFQDDLAVRNALNYATSFSIPFILCCPFKVYQPLKSTLELYSLDCKIGYVSPYSDMFDHLAAVVMSVIGMSVPYRLLECPTID